MMALIKALWAGWIDDTYLKSACFTKKNTHTSISLKNGKWVSCMRWRSQQIIKISPQLLSPCSNTHPALYLCHIMLQFEAIQSYPRRLYYSHFLLTLSQKRLPTTPSVFDRPRIQLKGIDFIATWNFTERKNQLCLWVGWATCKEGHWLRIACV